MPKIAGILMQKSLCKQKTIMFQVWYASYLKFKVNSIIEKYNISIHEIGADKIILKSHLNFYPLTIVFYQRNTNQLIIHSITIYNAVDSFSNPEVLDVIAKLW